MEAVEDPSPVIPKYKQRKTFIVELRRREKEIPGLRMLQNPP